MSDQPQMWRRTLNGFEPANDAARQVMRRTTIGSFLTTAVKQPRNVKHAAKYWALLNLIAPNLPSMSAEALNDMIKLRTGHYEVFHTRKGDVHIPKSISFSSLDQHQFEAFFDKAVQFILEDVIPGLGKDDLLREVEGVIEGHPRP